MTFGIAHTALLERTPSLQGREAHGGYYFVGLIESFDEDPPLLNRQVGVIRYFKKKWSANKRSSDEDDYAICNAVIDSSRSGNKLDERAGKPNRQFKQAHAEFPRLDRKPWHKKELVNPWRYVVVKTMKVAARYAASLFKYGGS